MYVCMAISLGSELTGTLISAHKTRANDGVTGRYYETREVHVKSPHKWWQYN